jgi:hypothetical protein
MANLISKAHAQYYLSFEELIETCKNPVRDFQGQLSLNQVHDEYDKYKLWAGNVGAAHSGNRYEISLDYRLREASFFKNQVSWDFYRSWKALRAFLELVTTANAPFAGAETLGDFG